MTKISKLSILPLILVVVCVISQPVEAKTSIYLFSPDQSIVVKTGGFAGVHETYSIAGRFQLNVDSDLDVASFEIVDANLTDETGAEYGRSLEEIFNMTGLAGNVIDEATIEFEGKTADGTRFTLTWEYQPRGILSRISDALGRRASTRRAIGRSLKNLKTLIEAS